MAPKPKEIKPLPTELQVRNANQGDVQFLYNTLKNCAKSAYLFRNMSQALFDAHFDSLFDKVINNSTVVIIGDKAIDTDILGFIIVEFTSEDMILHFAYTKYDYRQKGLFAKLINNLPKANSKIQYYLDTKAFTLCLQNDKQLKDNWNFVYNPFLF